MSVNQINYHSAGNVNWTEGTATRQIDPFIRLLSPNKGLTFPVSNYISLAPRKVNYTANTLGQTQHVYTTPSYDDIIALADYFADWGCSYEIQEGPTHTMTVNCPWDTISSEDFWVSLYASEQWELTPIMDVRPLYMNGLLKNSFASADTAGNWVVLPEKLKVAVQKAFESKTDLAIPKRLQGSMISASLAPYFPYAQKTLNYMRGGVDGVPSYTQILKRTAVIDKGNNNRAFSQAADMVQRSLSRFGTVNYMYSTPSLVNSFSIPIDTVGTFMLPSYRTKVYISGVDLITAQTYAGWLVKPPSFQFISRNKIQLTQEFVWNQYLDSLYFIQSPLSDFPERITPFVP